MLENLNEVKLHRKDEQAIPPFPPQQYETLIKTYRKQLLIFLVKVVLQATSWSVQTFVYKVYTKAERTA